MIVTSSISVFERLPVIRPWKTTSVRWQMLMISGSSEETTMIRQSRLRELLEQLVDLRLRADVDAARRLDMISTLQSAQAQQARQEELLLLAPER